jgi:hypothetical protein
VEENVDLRQRRMDAVSQGIISGLFAGSLVILGGSIALQNNTFQWLTEGVGLYIFLVILSALQVYTFVHLIILNNYFAELPKLNPGITVV